MREEGGRIMHVLSVIGDVGGVDTLLISPEKSSINLVLT